MEAAHDDRSCRKSSPLPVELSRMIELGHVKPGDLVVRLGLGVWSDTIRRMNTVDKRFSHVGILVPNGNAWAVIHAMGGRYSGPNSVISTPLELFSAESSAIAIFRSTNVAAIQERIARKAVECEGMPFDHSFSLASSSELYCSELAMLAVNLAHDQDIIRPRNVSDGQYIVLIEDCYSASNWELIYNYPTPSESH